MPFLKSTIQKSLKHFGYTLKKDFYPDFEADFLTLQKKIAPYTMTHTESQYAMYKAIRHILTHNIPGDIVECGVWRGGVSMIFADQLQKAQENRTLYLYDTFEGMSEPTENDVRFDGNQAAPTWRNRIRDDGANGWDYASYEDVERNIKSTGYPSVRLVKGKVENTIPAVVPGSIALLRLDTDWYESTKHELEQLFPLLSQGGILVIDDYGHWLGARKAVDEYFKEHAVTIFLNRIDHSARLGVKM